MSTAPALAQDHSTMAILRSSRQAEERDLVNVRPESTFIWYSANTEK
jgi:hypothetical protein